MNMNKWENMLSHLQETVMSLSTESFDILKKWLVRKIVTALAILGSDCTDCQLEKKNRKTYKEL